MICKICNKNSHSLQDGSCWKSIETTVQNNFKPNIHHIFIPKKPIKNLWQ